MKHKLDTSLNVNVALITVSTTRSQETDSSGKIIIDILQKEGIEIVYYTVIPDSIEAIQSCLFSALPKANCIIFCGGTGLTSDDCTIEAINPLVEKRIDGFGELFRWKSYQEMGTAAILSRAFAGTIKDKVVFCIPGSPAAARLALEGLIVPEIRHILHHLKR